MKRVIKELRVDDLRKQGQIAQKLDGNADRASLPGNVM
jgi:hypothetical protein